MGWFSHQLVVYTLFIINLFDKAGLISWQEDGIGWIPLLHQGTSSIFSGDFDLWEELQPVLRQRHLEKSPSEKSQMIDLHNEKRDI